jgi:hypothetical protein
MTQWAGRTTDWRFGVKLTATLYTIFIFPGVEQKAGRWSVANPGHRRNPPSTRAFVGAGKYGAVLEALVFKLSEFLRKSFRGGH